MLVFTFSSEKEFDPPMDPCGRGGPSLETFLHFPSQNHCPVPEPEIVSQPEPNLFKRQIIVDGSNVGHAYTGNARFNVTGIEKCLQYFLERGHEVKVYLAASMLEKREVSEEDKKKLRKLHNQDKLVPTPSRRTSIQSYDCYEVKQNLVCQKRSIEIISQHIDDHSVIYPPCPRTTSSSATRSGLKASS